MTYKATVITPPLTPETGGPTKTVGSFIKALEAKHICFCDKSTSTKVRSSFPQSKIVTTSNVPVASKFGWSSRASTTIASKELEDQQLISCHSFYRYHALWVEKKSKTLKIPYWFVPHGILDPWVLESGKFSKKAFMKFGGKRFIENANTVIFATKSEKEKASTLYNFNKTEVIPWPVESNEIICFAERRQRIRRNLRIPEDARVLLYIGRLHPMKRPLDTIRAVGQLATDKLHLIIVGNENGVTQNDCHRMALECKCLDRVHIIGAAYGEEKNDYFAASDAYISLSHRENFNHTAAESMAASLPVILSSGNDIIGEINQRNSFIKITSNTQDAATNAIEEFLHINANELREMGQKNKAWVNDTLNFSRFRESLQRIARESIDSQKFI